jgi:hypothetical protein
MSTASTPPTPRPAPSGCPAVPFPPQIPQILWGFFPFRLSFSHGSVPDLLLETLAAATTGHRWAPGHHHGRKDLFPTDARETIRRRAAGGGWVARGGLSQARRRRGVLPRAWPGSSPTTSASGFPPCSLPMTSARAMLPRARALCLLSQVNLYM